MKEKKVNFDQLLKMIADRLGNSTSLATNYINLNISAKYIADDCFRLSLKKQPVRLSEKGVHSWLACFDLGIADLGE